MKTKYAFLAPILLTLTMGLNSCGEKEVTIPNTLINDFGHTLPESFLKNRDLTSNDLTPFMDNGILFWGQSIKDPKDNTFDIGVQFHSETEGRTIFVEKLMLDTPDFKTESVLNEFVVIDDFSKSANLYFKRLIAFEKTNGDSIPLTADYFTLKIDYRLDSSSTKQISIRFDNTSVWVPNF